MAQTVGSFCDRNIAAPPLDSHCRTKATASSVSRQLPSSPEFWRRRLSGREDPGTRIDKLQDFDPVGLCKSWMQRSV